MSQEKVDRYKQEKANRKKDMAKQKMKKNLYIALGALVGVLAIVWIGFSFYWEAEQKRKDEEQSSIMAEYYSSYFESIMNTENTSSSADSETSSGDESTSGDEKTSDEETSADEKESSSEEDTTAASNE